MKKRALLFIILFTVVLVSTGCNVKAVSYEQSQKNFLYYENELNEICNNYNLVMDKVEVCDDEYGLHREYLIGINDSAKIVINFYSNASFSRSGREEFEISYTNNDSFNLELFTKLINAVSGWELSINYCKKFLSDSEDAHSPSKYGIEKTKDQLIYKYDFLNFNEDWSISYILYDDQNEKLEFFGLTKQLT